MCRDGYNVECSHPACETRVTCRNELGCCSEHGWDSLFVPESEPVAPRAFEVKTDVGSHYPVYERVTFLLHADGSVTWSEGSS